MPNSTTLKITIFILAVFGWFFLPVKAKAVDLDVATVYEVSDSKAVDGDILITTDKGLTRATKAYDSHLFGVLQNQSLLVFKRVDQKGNPVARYGKTEVNVTTVNGEIKEGDYITSSDIPGKGQKATLSGYVLGVATSAFSEKDGQKEDYKPTNSSEPSKKIASGKISVSIKIEYTELTQPRTASRFFDAFTASLFSSIKDPSRFAEIFRYGAAAGIVLLTFGFAFFTFSRSIPKSIEAIGRNPLAEKTIIFSVGLNIVFTIIVAALGVLAAIFILRL